MKNTATAKRSTRSPYDVWASRLMMASTFIVALLATWGLVMLATGILRELPTFLAMAVACGVGFALTSWLLAVVEDW